MDLLEIVLLAVGLSMDALAISICKGFSLKKASWKDAAVVALFFGGFQALMPVIGYLIGSSFHGLVESFSYLIAAALLIILGLKMIKDSMDEKEVDSKLDIKTLLVLSIASSIDALAVGISFSMVSVDLIPAIAIIGIVTFIISFIGVKSGSFVGSKFQTKAEMLGGIILIVIGAKILLEGLQII